MAAGEVPLIRTKLAPPRANGTPVSRQALLEKLHAARQHKLTLLLAPAGCGKTMLLTQWRQQLLLLGEKVAWYNAGADDSDLYFGAYIVESLEQAGLDIDREALHVYLRSNGKAWLHLIASLINDIHDHGQPVYVIIDDLHHLFSFGALKFLGHWISLAPDNCHLVLSSRTRPPVQLSRLQADNQLTEIHFPDLRFSQTETRQFLQSQSLSGLTPPQESALQKITDGWPAGLQMLAFTLRKQKNTAHFFEHLARQSLSRADALEQYMEAEISAQLGGDALGFLMRLSSCRRFNRTLAEHLTGDPQAGQRLAQLESENLFLAQIETADAEPWYRFHRLFADFLVKRFQRIEPAEVRRIHHLASRWFAERGLHIEAMRHASQAQDSEYVVQLIDLNARRMVNGANFVELLKWCDAVPRESLRRRLNVCLCAAWAQISCSRQDDLDRTMADIAAHPDSQQPEHTTEVQLLRASNHFRQDDTQAALAIVEPMIRDSAPVNPFNALLARMIMSMSLIYANDFEGAREVARLRYQIDTQDRPDYPRPLIDVVGGFSHLVQGNIHQAVVSLKAYIDDALARTPLRVDVVGLYSGYLVEALYQSGGIDQARDFLDRYLDLIDVVGTPDGQLFAYRVRSRIQHLDGNPLAAHETLLKLEEIGYQKRLDRIVAWSLHEQVALALREPATVQVHDLLPRLERLLQQYRPMRNCARGEIALAALMARAMSGFAAQTAAPALAAMDEAAVAASAGRRLLLSTQLSLMRAITQLNMGDANGATKLGRGAVAIAAEAGMMRVLPDLGALALPLTRQLLSVEVDSRSRILLVTAADILEPGGGQALPGQRPPSRRAETLSPREFDVLELVAKALSSKSIARVLNMSNGTVKWHLKNIFSKLDAVSREDALVKARRLGILS